MTAVPGRTAAPARAACEATANLGRMMTSLAELARGGLLTHGWTEAQIEARADGSAAGRRRAWEQRRTRG